MSSKHAYEKHSVNTLAHRFKGLASRNTIQRWLTEKKLHPEMVDKSAAPYLFVRKHLDDVAEVLDRAHCARVARATNSAQQFAHVRDTTRRNALLILRENQIGETGSRPRPHRREKDLALNDCDAMGGVRLSADLSEVRKIGNCDITGSPMKGKN